MSTTASSSAPVGKATGAESPNAIAITVVATATAAPICQRHRRSAAAASSVSEATSTGAAERPSSCSSTMTADGTAVASSERSAGMLPTCGRSQRSRASGSAAADHSASARCPDQAPTTICTISTAVAAGASASSAGTGVPNASRTPSGKIAWMSTTDHAV